MSSSRSASCMLAVMLVGCSHCSQDAGATRKDSIAPPGVPSTEQPPPELLTSPPRSAEKTLSFDLSGSEHGGVLAGVFNNFAFTLDFRDSVKKVALSIRESSAPGAVASDDFADCSEGQQTLLQRPLAELARGDAMWVESVELEMNALARAAERWEGGVCYGYRVAGGGWYWHLSSTPLSHDPAAGLSRAKLAIRKGPIDAIKLVFDYSVPLHFLHSVKVAARPIRD